MKKYDVIILGAGASGLMCASASRKNTLLLDSSDRVGKKILVTGNGKCNISNDKLAPDFYNTKLVEKYFAKFSNIDTLKYFEDIGLVTYSDDEGRRYPLSNSANSVLDLLLANLKDKPNVDILTNAKASKITKLANGFEVDIDKDTFFAHKLVIATGGNSAIEYMQDLGVKYVGFNPSLMALKTTKNKGLAGVRVSNVKVSYKDFCEIGEVLFKEDGVSGIVIFNLSATLSRANIRKATICIDLLPDLKDTKLKELLVKSLKNNPSYTSIELLEGLLHKALAKNILEKQGLDKKYAKEISDKDVLKLVENIKNYKVEVVGYLDNNQVHTGGVSLKDLDENLQYKDIPNLFFVGEVVDVDGVCGGYNLQWAWTSGKIVGDVL